ncbi:hypothetical protein [Halalkalicoccus salilacus]
MNERAREFVESEDEEVEDLEELEELEDEADVDEPTVRTTVNADD